MNDDPSIESTTAATGRVDGSCRHREDLGGREDNDEDDGGLCSLVNVVASAVGSGLVLAGLPVKRAISREKLEQFH